MIRIVALVTPASGVANFYWAMRPLSPAPRYVIYRHALDLPKVGVASGKVSKLK